MSPLVSLYDSSGLSGIFAPGPSPAYLFSKHFNRLEFDQAYPKNPSTLGEYIRKYRKDKGISQVDLAKVLGVNEMTIVNWEIRDKIPRIKAVKERLARTTPGTRRFL